MRPGIGRTLYYSLLLSLLVIWLGVAASVAWVVYHETEEIFDSSLQETAQRLLSLTSRDLQGKASNGRVAVSEPMEHDEYLTYQVFDQHGAMLMRSHDAPADAFPIPLRIGFYQDRNQYFYVEKNTQGTLFIQVAERANHRGDTLRGLLKFLLLPLGALLPLAALVIYWAVKSMQRSLLEFEREISTRGSKDLHPLNADTLPSELVKLGESINFLMERLKLALESERNFTANSAHELRTPLAVAIAQLDVLRDETNEPAAIARITVAHRMIKRLEKMMVKLLQLAKAESGTAINFSSMNLTALIELLLRDLSFQSSRKITFIQPDKAVLINGDLDAIGIVLQNLLENATRYASPDTMIHIELRPNGEIIIQNDCDAIPQAILKKLPERFVRATQLDTGSGIGLSIVEAILVQSNATLTLRSPCFENGRGFEAHVHFEQANQ